ncbi:hypothetical protein D3C87_1276060 [compost metagenome]
MSKKTYGTTVDKILKADLQSGADFARELREIERLSADERIEQLLIHYRLSIKMGDARRLDETKLVPLAQSSEFQRAEIHFVIGMILIHKEEHKAAAAAMGVASAHYEKALDFEKSLLSRFNGMLSLSNGDEISAQEELNLCNEIYYAAQEKGIKRLQALSLRQKSYNYYGQEKYLVALAEIEKALALIEESCPVSDHHLALVHAADCALSSGDKAKAALYLEYVPQEPDQRVVFPLQYIKARLMGEKLDLNLYQDISPHWRLRFEKHAQDPAVASTEIALWSQKTSSLILKKRPLGKIKSQSLEGQFLNHLIAGPKSKELLSELIWQDQASIESVDDRFFRLKSRISQKLGDILHFDGRKYSLKITIKKI